MGISPEGLAEMPAMRALKVEFHRELNDAMSSPVGHHTGLRQIIRGSTSSRGIVRRGTEPRVNEIQRRVAADKRPERMVEQVKCFRAELELASLAEGEILEYRQVSIGVPRTVDIGNPVAPIVSRGWRLEARGVKYLMRPEVRGWIADQNRYRVAVW